MSLDLPTLFLTSLVVTALLGGFMLVVRYRHRGGVEFAWWGVGYVLLSCGLILLALQERAPSWTAPLGNGLTLGSAGLLWGGTRALGGRPAYLWVVCGGMAIWALASLLPDFATNPLLRLTLRGLLSVLYTSLMAYELWPLRNRDLPLGWVATLWAGFHGLFIGGMTLGAWLIELPPSDAFYDLPMSSCWLSAEWSTSSCWAFFCWACPPCARPTSTRRRPLPTR